MQIGISKETEMCHKSRFNSSAFTSDGKAKVWRKKRSVYDAKHTSISVKHSGSGVMACACMAAPAMGALICIDDVTLEFSRLQKQSWYREMHPN